LPLAEAVARGSATTAASRDHAARRGATTRGLSLAASDSGGSLVRPTPGRLSFGTAAFDIFAEPNTAILPFFHCGRDFFSRYRYRRQKPGKAFLSSGSLWQCTE